MSHCDLPPEDPLELFLSENDTQCPTNVPAAEDLQASIAVADFQLPASELLETITGAAVLAVLASSLFMLAPPPPSAPPPLTARLIPQTLMLAPTTAEALVTSAALASAPAAPNVMSRMRTVPASIVGTPVSASIR
jgi:hypothetical protein